MIGYQSIPDTCCTYEESTAVNIAPSSTWPDAQPSSSSSPSKSTVTTHASSILTKIGLIGIGFLVGYHGAVLPRPRRTIRSAAVSSWLPPADRDTFVGDRRPVLDSASRMARESSDAFSFDPLKSLLGPSAVFFPTSSAGGVSANSQSPPQPPAVLKPHVLYHANEAAFSLLYDASNPKNYYLNEYALDYFLLTSGGFDAQINQAYCAVASVAALLNSLKYAKRFREGNAAGWTFDLPVDALYEPYPYATQPDILRGDCVSRNVTENPADDILRPPYGLNLRQTADLLACHLSSTDWDVTAQHADPAGLTLAKMRYDLKSALIDPDARLVINYDRRALNQAGAGHFSPVGAYHAATDSFLIMDVAKYKYPPVWVGADALFDAMSTVDECGWYNVAGGRRFGGAAGPADAEEYRAALEDLGCRPMRRGYIIVRRKSR
ncbi:hypothetical protein ACHAW6_010940 [Cyclotella cf. meneghiniana]